MADRALAASSADSWWRKTNLSFRLLQYYYLLDHVRQCRGEMEARVDDFEEAIHRAHRREPPAHRRPHLWQTVAGSQPRMK
jgi:hypothetical protein